MRKVDKLVVASLLCSAVVGNLFMLVAWWPIAALVPLAFVGSLKYEGAKRLFVFCSLFALGTAILLSFKTPYGGWDAVTFWNYKAGSLYLGDWRSTAGDIDHPLLIPSLIAIVWRFLGAQSPAVPAFIAIGFGIGVVALIVQSLRKFRSTDAALLAGATLLLAPTFVIQTASQYADVPLALLILATLALIIRGKDALAGFTAGLAALTKNEGSLFIVAFLVAVILVQRSFRQLCKILCGLAPPLTILIWFKVSIAPRNLVLSSPRVTDGLLDSSRYLLILCAFLTEILNVSNWGPALVALLLLPLLGIKVDAELKSGIAIGVIILGIMLAGYFVVYLITPLDLKMHLGTSLNRLLMQLLPTAVVLLFLALRLPEKGSLDEIAFGDVEPSI